MGISNDEHWMQLALDCAKQAEQAGEVPIGAVLVQDDTLIAQGFNQTITQKDPTAHAEIQVIRAASKALNNHRLLGSTLYVSLQPCVMCIGAIVQARIERVVYGAIDHKHCTSELTQQLIQEDWGNHKVAWEGGVLADACGQLLKDFFQKKR